MSNEIYTFWMPEYLFYFSMICTFIFLFGRGTLFWKFLPSYTFMKVTNESVALRFVVCIFLNYISYYSLHDLDFVCQEKMDFAKTGFVNPSGLSGHPFILMFAWLLISRSIAIFPSFTLPAVEFWYPVAISFLWSLELLISASRCWCWSSKCQRHVSLSGPNWSWMAWFRIMNVCGWMNNGEMIGD